jgi:hypothetical protein
MYLFRRLALLLAISLSAIYVVQAEEPSSSSSTASFDPAQAHTPIQPNPPADTQTQPATPQQPAAQPQAPAQAQTPAPADAQSQQSPSQAAQAQGQISVQARIKARREQRRAQAIHEIYDHLYDGYVGAGYLRFIPGSKLQRVNMYDWNFGFTRYFSERLGVTVDGRGYYGTPFIEPIQDGGSGITKPAISVYSVMGGPTYRFYIQPKFSVSGRVMAGYAQGNFTGDTNGFGSLCTQGPGGSCALWPDGPTFAANASIFVEFNLAPNLGIRIAPEYMLTGFGSSLQNGLGYTGGLVYRFGKQ